MPATINHIYTHAVADGTATSVVRPSDWNSVHSAVLNAVGSEISGAFSNANGVSFGLSGTAVTASIVPGLSNLRVSAGTTSNLLSALTFNNGNGISFGLDSSTFTASHNGLTSQSNQAVSAANGSYAFQTLSFSNANGISFGTSGGSAITGSHNGITSQSNQQMTFFATGNTTQSSTGTTNASSVIFRGEGVASVGITNGSVVISVPAGGGGLTNINVSAGTTSNNLSALTFSNGSGVSFGLNGSTMTASVVPPFTYSAYIPDIYANEALSGQQGQGTFFLQPLANVPNFQFDNFVMPVEYTNASNTSGSFTVSFWVGLYSRNASTLSLVISTSASANITNSGTVGSYSLYGGQRNFSIGWTNTVLASDYWLGIGSRTTTGGAAGMTLRQMLASNITTGMSGYFGAASNATQGWAFGQGFYSATTAAVPNSIGFTQIQQSGSLNRRVPIFMFQSNLF